MNYDIIPKIDEKGRAMDFKVDYSGNFSDYTEKEETFYKVKNEKNLGARTSGLEETTKNE